VLSVTGGRRADRSPALYTAGERYETQCSRNGLMAMLIEILLGCVLMLMGALCIIHWVQEDTGNLSALFYGAGNLLVLIGLTLFFGALLHSCAAPACDDVNGCVEDNAASSEWPEPERHRSLDTYFR